MLIDWIAIGSIAASILLMGGLGLWALRISDQLRSSQRELRDAYQRLAHAQETARNERFSAMSEMASTIAHDFNNALTPLLGYTEMVLTFPDILDDRETLKDYVQRMSRAAQAAEGVVRQLRSFYYERRQQEPFEPVDINSLLLKAVHSFDNRLNAIHRLSGSVIQINTDLQAKGAVLGRSTELQTLFTHIISNAIEAMPQGGTATITTRVDGDHFVVSVADTGVGMSEEVRKSSAELGFILRGDHGTGIGFSVINSILLRHYGSLEIASEPGKGTTVAIKLPTVNEAKAEASAGQPLPGQLRILILAAESPTRHLLESYMTQEGHAVTLASGGDEALERLGKATFDIIFIDASMQSMSGGQIIAALKLLPAHTQVVVLESDMAPLTAAQDAVYAHVQQALFKAGL